ncbi:MAG: hypothetical protein JWQ44_74 [Chthoniobacter sp.]|jgi:hypothetical protein|nr:hypothetical protein [Chthoniobacter sp.]
MKTCLALILWFAALHESSGAETTRGLDYAFFPSWGILEEPSTENVRDLLFCFRLNTKTPRFLLAYSQLRDGQKPPRWPIVVEGIEIHDRGAWKFHPSTAVPIHGGAVPIFANGQDGLYLSIDLDSLSTTVAKQGRSSCRILVSLMRLNAKQTEAEFAEILRSAPFDLEIQGEKVSRAITTSDSFANAKFGPVGSYGPMEKPLSRFWPNYGRNPALRSR